MVQEEEKMAPYIRDESGATMVEYAMLVSLIFAVAVLAVQAFGGSVLDLFSSAAGVMP